ncbi:MAG: RluA family pseudouridine synthase [Planctomycetota bacterium]
MNDGQPREFAVDADEAGARIEQFLVRQLGFSRGLALKALRKGWVRLDGKRAKPGVRLVEHARVKVTNYALPIEPPERAPRGVPPAEVQRARSSLLARDPAFLISDKPWGQVVHAGSGHPWGWTDALGHALGEACPTPIGRLDRDTSGLLILARGRAAARALFAQLQDGRLERVYQARVLGHPAAEGEVALPLSPRGEGERVEARPDGLPSRTGWRRLAQDATSALLELRLLEGGRKHQIRAHLAAIGHPLLGDPRYGTEASRAASRALGIERLALHAAELRAEHPETGAPLVYSSGLPTELARGL